MVVGVLKLVLLLPANRSLKGKRSVVNSIKSRIAHRFNVSVVEAADLDSLHKISLGVVQAGNDRSHVDRSLREVARFIRDLHLARSGEESYCFDNY
ncbi:MAG: DUF503 domain-containing protein [Candidatus Binatia bacterium]